MSESNCRRTPLFPVHQRLGAKLAPFGGWEMPIHYGSQVEEHHATRNECGLFDVSHMGQIHFAGPGAAEAVQACVTCNVGGLGDGEQSYGALCNKDGGMIDDLFVARLNEENFLLVVNAATYEGDVNQMLEVIADRGISDLQFIPCMDDWAMIAVQGPKWIETLTPAIGDGPWKDLPRNRILELTYHDTTMLFSTTGYTGEPGCELMVSPKYAETLWNSLAEAGGRPVGLAARDTLRLEQGYCLSGSDFTTENNPLEARISWAVALDQDFCGRDAIAKIKADGGPSKRLTGLLSEGRRIPRHGASILKEGEPVGEVTSGGFSPTLGRPIALGYVAIEHSKNGVTLEIDLGRGNCVPAETARPPFVKINHGA